MTLLSNQQNGISRKYIKYSQINKTLNFRPNIVQQQMGSTCMHRTGKTHVTSGIQSPTQIQTPQNNKIYSEAQVQQLLKKTIQDLKQQNRSLLNPSQNIPNSCICPISQQVMMDPVIAADGHTYERRIIGKWLEGHTTSPMTNETLANNGLIPNYAIRKAISEYRENPANINRTQSLQNNKPVNSSKLQQTHPTNLKTHEISSFRYQYILERSYFHQNPPQCKRCGLNQNMTNGSLFCQNCERQRQVSKKDIGKDKDGDKIIKRYCQICKEEYTSEHLCGKTMNCEQCKKNYFVLGPKKICRSCSTKVYSQNSLQLSG